jgi:hypothetical protein
MKAFGKYNPYDFTNTCLSSICLYPNYSLTYINQNSYSFLRTNQNRPFVAYDQMDVQMDCEGPGSPDLDVKLK